MTRRPDTQSTQDILPETSEPSDDKPLPKLTLNPDRYREHLSEFALTIEQQNDMMQVLWNIMNTFVDIGWGVDTVQMFLPELFEKAGPDSGNLVKQRHTLSFNTKTTHNIETKDYTDDE